MKRLPWTKQELEQFLPKLDKQLSDIEATEVGIKPLPAMEQQECLDYFYRLMDIAAVRPLTKQETFLHGQLLAVYAMAVTAEVLGKKGRSFVIHEDKINEILGGL